MVTIGIYINGRCYIVVELITIPMIPQEQLEEMYSYRLRRIIDIMREKNISLCIVTNPVNMRYAINFDEYLMFQSHIPTSYLFISIEGSVVLFGASKKNYPNVDQYVKSRFITPFDGGLDLYRNCSRFVSDIKKFIADNQLEQVGKTIATERLPPLIISHLIDNGFKLVDGECLIENAKSIKNTTEINCIKHSIQVAEYGIQLMHESLRPEITENQLWSIMHQVNVSHGGDWIEGHMLASGPRTNPWLQEANGRSIEQGDMVAFDTDMIGPKGYLADISRSWVCGGGIGTRQQRHAYQHAYDEINYNMELIKPGISFRELSKKLFKRKEEYKAQRYVCALHGAGLSDEYPKVYYEEDWNENSFEGQVEENMVLCIESYSGVKNGREGVKLEEMVKVTKNGYEKLSQYPFEAELLA